jgi:hypothetical protein
MQAYQLHLSGFDANLTDKDAKTSKAKQELKTVAKFYKISQFFIFFQKKNT